VRSASLGVRFACELAALVAVGWWGWTVSAVLVVVLPLLVAVVWGAFVAPRARRRVPDPARLALEVVIFAAATACFLAVGQQLVAVVFAVAAVVTALLVRKWPEPVGSRPLSDTASNP
jgi:membrane protein implicated in regulation of membrane protease activity